MPPVPSKSFQSSCLGKQKYVKSTWYFFVVHRPRHHYGDWEPALPTGSTNIPAVIGIGLSSTLPALDRNGKNKPYDEWLTVKGFLCPCVPQKSRTQGQQIKYAICSHGALPIPADSVVQTAKDRTRCRRAASVSPPIFFFLNWPQPRWQGTQALYSLPWLRS